MNRLRTWLTRLLGHNQQPVYPAPYWLMSCAWLCPAVYVVAKLEVADRLRDGPLALERLAAECGVQAVPLRQVMRALAGFGIFTVDHQGRFELNAHSRRLLRDDPDSVRPYSLVCGEQLWPAASRLLEQLQTGRTGFEIAHGSPIWEHYARNPSDADVFDTFMSAATDAHVRRLATAYPFARHRRVVDVGAGRGSLLRAILTVAPRSYGIWYDRAEVLPAAEEHMTAAGLASRCEFRAGSFLEHVPGGADLYVIKHVLHDWPDEPAGTILGNIAAAMATDSTLLIVEALLDERPGGDGLVKVRDLEQMFWTGGRVRSREDFSRILEPVGLAIDSVARTPIADMCLIRVRKRH